MAKKDEEKEITSFSFGNIQNEAQAQSFYDTLIAQEVAGDIFVEGAGYFRPGDTTAYPSAVGFDKKKKLLLLTFNIYGQDFVFEFEGASQIVITDKKLRMQAKSMKVEADKRVYNHKLTFELG